MAPRRKLYSVWLDHEDIAALKEVRDRDGVLPSEQVRRALAMWFASKRVTPKTKKPRRKGAQED